MFFLQLIFAVLLLFSTTLCVALPHFLCHRSSGTSGSRASLALSTRVLLVANLFSAGVFVSSAFVGLLRESVHTAMGFSYPFIQNTPFLFVCFGFLFPLFLEHVVFARQHSHAGPPSGASHAVLTAVLTVHSAMAGLSLGLARSPHSASSIFLSLLAHKPLEAFALGSALEDPDSTSAVMLSHQTLPDAASHSRHRLCSYCGPLYATVRRIATERLPAIVIEFGATTRTYLRDRFILVAPYIAATPATSMVVVCLSAFLRSLSGPDAYTTADGAVYSPQPSFFVTFFDTSVAAFTAGTFIYIGVVEVLVPTFASMHKESPRPSSIVADTLPARGSSVDILVAHGRAAAKPTTATSPSAPTTPPGTPLRGQGAGGRDTNWIPIQLATSTESETAGDPLVSDILSDSEPIADAVASAAPRRSSSKWQSGRFFAFCFGTEAPIGQLRAFLTVLAGTLCMSVVLLAIH